MYIFLNNVHVNAFLRNRSMHAGKDFEGCLADYRDRLVSSGAGRAGLARFVTIGTASPGGRRARKAGEKILMMTGSSDRILEFDGAGQPYLSKPFPPDVFLQRVEELLASC